MNKTKVVFISLGGLFLIPLIWFFVFDLELRHISSPAIDYFLGKAGIKDTKYEVVSLNREELSIKDFSSKNYKFSELKARYNLSGEIDHLLLKDSIISFAQSQSEDKAVAKPKPLNLKEIIELTPNSISIENLKLSYQSEKLSTDLVINLKSKKEKNIVLIELKLKGRLVSFNNLSFNAILNIEINNSSIVLNKSRIDVADHELTFPQEDGELKIKFSNLNLKKIKFSYNPNSNIMDAPLSLALSLSELISGETTVKGLILSLNGSINKLRLNTDASYLNYTTNKDGPAYISPLKLNISGSKEKNILKLHLNSSILSEKNLKLKADLLFNLTTLSGFVKAKIPVLDLGIEYFNLEKVSPFMSDEKLILKGKFGLKMNYPINQNPKKGNVELNLKDVSVKYNSMQLSYMDLKAKLYNFGKLHSNQQQSIAINRIKVGQSIENIKLKWSFDSKTLKVENLSAEVLGGKASIKKLEVIPLSKRIKPFTFAVNNLDLQQVLAIGLDKGLVAKGKLNGILHISMNEKGKLKLKGSLKSKSAGVIQYNNQVTNNMGSRAKKSVGIMVRYLKNMHYKNLEILLETDNEYNLRTVINLSGKNPKLKTLNEDLVDLAGKPLKLSLNLDLNIIKALKSYLLAVELPKKIEENLINSLDLK